VDTLRFKFKWLDNQGNEAGILSKKGSFDGKTLVLDDVQLPAACLTTVESRSKRFVIATVDHEGKIHQALFNLTSGSADKLRAALGLCRSRAWAEAHREELAKAGKAHEFRIAVCPHCQATIDLTSMPSSPQVYCRSATPSGRSTRPKPRSRPRPSTGCATNAACTASRASSQSSISTSCSWLTATTNRRHGDARRVCAGSLENAAGQPAVRDWRARRPGPVVPLLRRHRHRQLVPRTRFRQSKSPQGNIAGAIEGYRRILSEHPVAAGIKFNIGQAALSKNDLAGAAGILEHALHDCANYQPAAATLAGCYERLGETEKLHALRKQWGVEEEQSPPSS